MMGADNKVPTLHALCTMHTIHVPYIPCMPCSLSLPLVDPMGGIRMLASGCQPMLNLQWLQAGKPRHDGGSWGHAGYRGPFQSTSSLPAQHLGVAGFKCSFTTLVEARGLPEDFECLMSRWLEAPQPRRMNVPGTYKCRMARDMRAIGSDGTTSCSVQGGWICKRAAKTLHMHIVSGQLLAILLMVRCMMPLMVRWMMPLMVQCTMSLMVRWMMPLMVRCMMHSW